MTGRPLLTFTANALWETTLHLERPWEIGGTARAARQTEQVGGKGLNVSRVLQRLGAPSEAWLCLGGETGQLCRAWLRRQGTAYRDFPAASPTRSGTVLRAPGRAETTFLGPDCRLDAGCMQAVREQLCAQADGGVLALCGSVPDFGEHSHAPLAQAFSAWSERGQLAVDSYGPFLRWAIHLPLALLKINRTELGSCIGQSLTAEEVPSALEALAAQCPRVARWVVTDGPGAAWACEGAAAAAGWAPADCPEVSPTGAGDVVMASLMEGALHRGLPLHKALPRALALATAKASSAETVEFPLEKAERFPPRRIC